MCLGPASRLFRFFFIADLRTRQWTPVRQCGGLLLLYGLLSVLVRQSGAVRRHSCLVLTMFPGLPVLVPESMGAMGSSAGPDDP